MEDFNRYGDRRNNEGYLDLTASDAISHCMEPMEHDRGYHYYGRYPKHRTEEEAVINEANFLLRVIKYIIRNSGFECNRIILRHKKTGREFR